MKTALFLSCIAFWRATIQGQEENLSSMVYDCSLPGLEHFVPGQYEGVTANYLSFVTDVSSPNFPIRAAEFEACTGGTIVFSDANNIWEDPINDLGTKTRTGGEIYDGYFMSYSHFPEVSELDLAEHLNDRIRKDNARLKWEDVMPKVQAMSQYRKDGVSNIDFMMYDGDFFVPIIRLDLLEKYDLPMPNTWEELIEFAKFFDGKDINDDGEPDYSICHFPRSGAGYWDWWFSELVYSTWATTDQLKGTEQGFLFDPNTLEPNIGPGFERAVNVWKDIWDNGAGACDGVNMETGRCAVGYGPPGCWKGTFLNGVERNVNGTVVWKPTMKDGSYAEPYQLKPFGSTQVVDPETKKMVPCTPELCPKAEVVPAKGHHGDDDRARVLVPSPLEGQLINRAPFYWSGGLGTLIRKNADPAKKDLLWDFFVYTNSPETSVYDVSSYNSWLDSWRFSQLGTDNQYGNAGWSLEAFEEHKAIQTWGLSSKINGAFNLRLPGAALYTYEVLGSQFQLYIDGETSITELKANVYKGWNKINTAKGTLDQLDIYRASLGLDVHTEVESCRLNREHMDDKDPSICRKYDAQENENGILIGILSACLIVMFAVVVCVVMDQRRRKSLKESLEEDDRDEIIEVERLIFQDNRFISVTRVVLVAAGIAATVGMTMWYQEIQTDAGLESQRSSLYTVILPISFCVLLIIFAVYDWLIARRNRKLIVNAAKTSEVVTQMFPGKFRDKVLDQTRVVRGGQNDDTDVTERSENQALAELFPDVTVFMADISGFTAWASVREPHQIFTFLEQVFGIFDKAAKKRKVFKVETIGDCYVACTGAPYVQADHAERMCRFASDIMESFIEVLDVLALKHGPDTTDLGLRCGIHSGVVTMGVLRNERARFQLFGDCVNTASRMESTSDPGFIQVSRETADLLFEAGKDKWLSPRGESVIAKGKGVMDTFWLDVNRVKESKAQTDTDSSVSEDSVAMTKYSSDTKSITISGGLSVSNFQNNALVDWNTESLLGLIKRIVAHRKGTKGSALTVPAADAFGLPSRQTFTNEVAEIIQLPRFEHASPEHLLAADTVLIDDVVVKELRNLIQQVANLYNDNPFHNFEHASHVTMSILKLLSRIVQPSGDDFDNVADHSYGITADPLTHFACAFCGLIHDADHPGVSNPQLIKENEALGRRYQNKSVAEQNSLSLCFDLLSSDDFANLRKVLFANDDDQMRFRQIVVNSVMATDIFDPDLKTLRNDRWNVAFSETNGKESPQDTINRKATIVIEHLIQASDVAHTMQHWKVYRKWNERLLEEMYLAYIQGRSEKDPTENWAQGEIGFFDFYIIPLAKKLKDCGVFGVSSDEYLNYALINRRKWKEEGEAITSQMVAKLKAMHTSSTILETPGSVVDSGNQSPDTRNSRSQNGSDELV